MLNIIGNIAYETLNTVSNIAYLQKKSAKITTILQDHNLIANAC